ncbi:Ig-like domain-containing protein [Methanobrevibacter sp.]|uniref:Ig-like domain-containing protein n=1 Tax=Methanobrevibacter sp. TaxID=66852 RepID=UPI0038631A62
MINKKILFLTVLLVSLLAISTVNAADNLTEDIVCQSEDNNDEIFNVECCESDALNDSETCLEISENQEELDLENNDDEYILNDYYGENDGFKIRIYNVTTTYDEGGDVIAYIISPEGKTGNINLLIDNQLYSSETISSYMYFYKDNLKYGIHDIKVQYESNDMTKVLYEGKIEYAYEFYFDTDIPKNVMLYDFLSFCFYSPEDSGGSVKYNGKTETFDSDDVCSIRIPIDDTFRIGTNNITISLSNNLYYPNSFVYSFDVSPRYDLINLISLGENDSLILEFPKDYSGVVNLYNLTYDDETYDIIKDQLISTSEIIDGKAILTFNKLKEGDHDLIINCSGDGDYEEIIYSFIVIDNNPLFNASLNENIVEFGEDVSIKLTSPRSSNFASIYVDNELYKTVLLTNSKTEYISNLDVGEHKIKVVFYEVINGYDDEKFPGDPLYSNTLYVTVKEKSKATSLSVKPIKTFYKDINYLNATLKDINGDLVKNVTISVNIDGDDQFFTTNNNGQISIPTTNLLPGNHLVLLNFEGTAQYQPSNAISTVTVNKINTTITTKEVLINEGETANIVVDVNDDASGIVLVNIGGRKNYGEIDNGKAIISYEGLASGNYTASITYLGDERYNKAYASTNVNVKKSSVTPTFNMNAADVSIMEGEIANIVVNVNDDASGIVLVNIGNYKYYGIISNGKALVSCVGISSGKYTANITYLGDERYNKAYAHANVQVNPKAEPILPDVKVSLPTTVQFGDTVDVKVNLPKDALGNIAAFVDGEKVKDIAISQGLANVQLKNLSPGHHIIEIKYDGDEKYASCDNVSYVTVNNKLSELIPTVIEADYTFTRQANDFSAGERGDFFYARLKDINGKPLANKICYVAVNGPIYEVKTDSQGRFGVKVNLAAANTYTYALSFLGDNQYGASFNCSKLILTPKKTSISASTTLFKASAKTKTISVTLKTVQNPYDGKTYLKAGKKINLKINGVSYTANINSKGVAKFNIKLAKKGIYSAKFTFAGDKTYKSSSKSIKVVIV